MGNTTSIIVGSIAAVALVGAVGLFAFGFAGAAAIVGVILTITYKYLQEKLLIQLKVKDNRLKASESNIQGNKSMDRGDFDRARELFERAYRTTDNADPEVPTYKRNIDRAKAAKLNHEGKNLVQQNDLLGAVEKFTEAIKTLKNYSDQTTNAELTTYKNNLADVYNKIGTQYFDRQNFEKAVEYFKKAVNSSSGSNSRIGDYRKNVEMAKSAISNRNAEIYNKQGWEAFNRGDYDVAISKFKSAYNSATRSYVNKNQFNENRKRAEGELYNKEGLKALNEGNFTLAKKKFQQAIAAAPQEFKHLYKNNLDNATAEELYAQAISLHDQENYEAAINKFNEALKILPQGEVSRRTVIKDTLAKTHNAYGEQLYTKNEYLKSSEHFTLAVSLSSPNNSNLKKYKENLNDVEWEILIKESDDHLLKIKNIEGNDRDSKIKKIPHYEESLSRINQSIETIPDKYLNRLNSLKMKKVKIHEEYGDILMSIGDFENAGKHFVDILDVIEEIPEEKNSAFKLRITGKVTEARVGYFNNEYEAIMSEIAFKSDECAIEDMTNLRNSFKATADHELTEEQKEKLHKQLENLTTNFLKRRSFTQAVQAANIGKKYFPEKSKLYDQMLEEKKLQDFNQDHLKNKFESFIDEKIIKDGRQIKFMSG